jgi:hypothetical protein
MRWGVHTDGWWGEGEVKFSIDGDAEHPTICGTGVEDYCDLCATVQVLGSRPDGRYLPGQHDICSVAYWYQALPTAPLPRLADRDFLEVV